MYTVEKLPSPINFPNRKSFADRRAGRVLLETGAAAGWVFVRSAAAVESTDARSGDCCVPPGDTGSLVGCSVIRSFVFPVESAMAVSSELFTSALDSCALVDDDEHVASPTDITSDLVISEVESAIAVFDAMIGDVSSSSRIWSFFVSGLIRFDCCVL